MKKYRYLSIAFFIAGVLSAKVMCAVVAYQYRDML